MRRGLFLILLAIANGTAVPAQPVFSDTTHPGSDESFINQVYRFIVDSSFHKYYLFEEAAPCSFLKYDYDEWLRYALRKTVPIYTLNELSQHAYEDRRSHPWRQDSLLQARCINRREADSILDPFPDLRSDTSMPARKEKRIWARRWRIWSRKPAEDRTVFYFSRPVYTDDGQYALLDMDFRCDDRQCGQGTICLFRREGSGWILTGKYIRWGQ